MSSREAVLEQENEVLREEIRLLRLALDNAGTRRITMANPDGAHGARIAELEASLREFADWVAVAQDRFDAVFAELDAARAAR